MAPNDEGWLDLPDLAPIAEVLELGDLTLLDDLTHPVRGALLRRLGEPASVAEVAAQLDVPVTRLYHHVHRLTEAGLIRVVATRRSGSATQSRYQVVARSIRLSPELVEGDPRAAARATAALFDVARHEFERFVEADTSERFRERSELVLGELTLPPHRVEDLLTRLRDIAEEFRSEPSPESIRMTMLLAAFPEPEPGGPS